MTRSPDIAYVAEGKLYVQRADQPAAVVESPFVQSILDRAEKTRARNDWKTAGVAWDLGNRMRGPMGGMTAGVAAEVRRVRFTGITAAPGVDGPEMYYALDTDYVGGLFHYEIKTGYERRLYHRNQFRATDLSANPADGTLAFTVHNPDGTARLATISPQGRGIKELTEGDAVDEAPSWAAGPGNVLYFQSAGVGRNARGMRSSLSPYAIQKLDLDANKMEMVVEHDDVDALSPRIGADGILYYILRPYLPEVRAVSPWKLLMDMMLFPFRLVRAIAHFLNFFSLMFSQKPLMTSGGPPREGPDERIVMLWGRVVDARKAARTGKIGEPEKPLVPADWRLVKRTPDGAETVVAKHVLSFDLCPGGVVYSDGFRIYNAPDGGSPTEIGRGKMIERVTALSI